jgi:Lrp/AsnC family leucine-responsive transcriptional regulator
MSRASLARAPARPPARTVRPPNGSILISLGNRFPRVDRLDFELLSALFRDARASYESLGETVGLTANAVKARVRRMSADGLLQGFAAHPAPGLLGLREGLLVFTGIEDLEDREDDLLRNLPDVSGIRFMDVTHDRSLVLWVQHRDDADWERIERAAASLVGKPPAWDLRLPAGAPERALTAADWRIVRALVPDGRLALKEIVKRSNVSTKTAKRRLNGLLESGALRIEPVLSTSETGGAVLFTLVAQLRDGAHARDLLSLLPETTIVTGEHGSHLAVFHVQRRTLREAQADHRALKASPLVERVVFAIATRRRADAWLEDAAAMRALHPAAPVPAAAPVVAPPPVPVASNRS